MPRPHERSQDVHAVERRSPVEALDEREFVRPASCVYACLAVLGLSLLSALRVSGWGGGLRLPLLSGALVPVAGRCESAGKPVNPTGNAETPGDLRHFLRAKASSEYSVAVRCGSAGRPSPLPPGGDW